MILPAKTRNPAHPANFPALKSKRNPFCLLKKTHNSGFTLAELLLAIYILLIGVLTIVIFLTTTTKATEYAGDLTAATIHAERIFEEMRTRTTLAEITATNWAQWAQDQNLLTLPSESVSVSIADAGADPLVIHTTVSWVRRLKQNNVVLSTEMTK